MPGSDRFVPCIIENATEEDTELGQYRITVQGTGLNERYQYVTAQRHVLVFLGPDKTTGVGLVACDVLEGNWALSPYVVVIHGKPMGDHGSITVNRAFAHGTPNLPPS